MGLKLNAGVSKKVGLPDYGSLGASCRIEVELDQALSLDDADSIQDRVKQAFAACRQAVSDELARQQKANTETATGSQSKVTGNTNGRNGHNGHAASQKQLDYAKQLADQISGLGVRRLEKLSTKMFDKPQASLRVNVLDQLGHRS